MLTGLKTYIIAAVAALSAILGIVTGEVGLVEGLIAIGLATGLWGDRLVLKAVEIVNSPSSLTADPNIRMWVTHAGTALAVLSAVYAGVTGQTDPVAVISAILSALGINFLGLGAKKLAT